MVNGAPSTNPRYLQQRPDLANPRDSYLAEIAARLAREIPAERPVYQPVNAVLAGRQKQSRRSQKRHAAAGGLRTDPLSGTARAVHGFHRQLDRQIARHHRIRKRRRADQRSVQCAVAGGGSEQRAGVGDCDRLRGFTTSAGYVGPNFRVDHDVSLLVPEIWCRMRVHERDPEFLKAHGYLEQV